MVTQSKFVITKMAATPLSLLMVKAMKKSLELFEMVKTAKKVRKVTKVNQVVTDAPLPHKLNVVNKMVDQAHGLTFMK